MCLAVKQVFIRICHFKFHIYNICGMRNLLKKKVKVKSTLSLPAGAYVQLVDSNVKNLWTNPGHKN